MRINLKAFNEKFFGIDIYDRLKFSLQRYFSKWVGVWMS